MMMMMMMMKNKRGKFIKQSKKIFTQAQEFAKINYIFFPC